MGSILLLAKNGQVRKVSFSLVTTLRVSLQKKSDLRSSKLHQRDLRFTRRQRLTGPRSLSIAFDDDLQIIRVTGKHLRFGDRHFPAPTELIIGRAPGDVILTRRATSKEGGVWHCFTHPMKCWRNWMHHLTLDFDSPEKHIDFNSKENEPRKKYWPPE